ncbi:MAG: sigma-70 family RNA polymerase sigma factor [Acidobacteriota bacterium]|nr:sigma-70 family RNA polymerase sigma factor [Acidobacteriota bacterium]
MTRNIAPELDAAMLSGILDACRGGEPGALENLMALVYDELRRIARGFLVSERDGHTLQATAVVHEAYMAISKANAVAWENPAHFFHSIAQTMRRILVDYARGRNREKRGNGQRPVTLSDDLDGGIQKCIDVIALDEALGRLSKIDARKAHLVELRFFAGMNLDETADCLGISRMTVHREWRRARAWLYRELSP